MNDLIAFLEARNAETEAWVAVDPTNRWASTYVTDPAHWEERGIFTLEDFKRDELITFIYEGHKDAFGVKGRHYDFASMSFEELEQEADYISRAIARENEREAEQAAHDIAEFQALVAKTIEMGAGDEETALRWLTQGEDFYGAQDVEHWVWKQGLLFTDYGKELNKKLLNLVEYKQWEAA